MRAPLRMMDCTQRYMTLRFLEGDLGKIACISHHFFGGEEMHPTETLGDKGFQGPKAFGVNPATAAQCAYFSHGREKYGLA